MQDQQKLIKQSKNCWLITFGTGKWTLQQLWRQIFCFSCFNLWCEACSGELKGEQNYCRRKCCKVMQLFVGAIRSNFDMISLDSFHSPSLPNLRQQLPSTVSGQKYSQKITTTIFQFFLEKGIWALVFCIYCLEIFHWMEARGHQVHQERWKNERCPYLLLVAISNELLDEESKARVTAAK